MVRRVAIVLALTLAASGWAETVFNGKNLDGWVGDPQYWSVKDGAITGSSDKDIPKTTYLYWKGKPLEDFQLRVKYKIQGGNSGIQYRSKVSDPKDYQVVGYQADIDSNGTHTGILYEQGGRGICTKRGQKVTLKPGGKRGKKVVTGATGDPAELLKHVKADDWNEYVITAREGVLTHAINGKLMTETIDEDAQRRVTQGILAVQLHKGAPMTVQFKDFRLRRLGDQGTPAKQPAKAAEPKAAFKLPIKSMDGFKVELVYQVPKHQMGSWVSMTFDDEGRIYASDQYEAGLYRLTMGAAPKAEKVHKTMSRIQGMVWHDKSLFVVVSHPVNGHDRGIYRLRDTSGDGQLDETKLLYTLKGGTEHGPHGLIIGPDGKLYFAGGNATVLAELTSSRVPRRWQEDQLLPRMWDARGHAKGRLAPGGFVMRLNVDGSEPELISIGFRNQYDIAFNKAGDLFTYDADMEWDLGVPWYRPTRVNHVISGSEFGWRAGTGKWPDYYADSFGSVVDVGQGSPTGVVFGYGAKFPAKYQNALYVADWSWGKLYACHLSADGSSYVAETEVLASGTPMPITDLEVSPKDGHMYFTTGGRKADSGVYRIRYVGKASTAPAAAEAAPNAANQQRRELEKLHVATAGAVAKAWPALASRDRGVRYAARTALEHQPVTEWAGKVFAETRPLARAEAAVALARSGAPEHRAALLKSLNNLDWDKADVTTKLTAIRAYQLAFIRLGDATKAEKASVVAKLGSEFPTLDDKLNRELAPLAVYLEAPWAAERLMSVLLDPATGNQSQIHYALVLRNLKSGWTLEQQKAYYEWFNRAAAFGGGMSFKGFIKNIKNDAIAKQEASKNPALAEAIKDKVVTNPFAGITPPKGPGKNWTVSELATAAKTGMKGRDFVNGRKMYASGMCITCHAFKGAGGAVGPELTAAGGRFTAEDLLEAIINPNAEISDQYAATIFTRKDGTSIVGRITNVSKNEEIVVSTNVYDPSQLTRIPLKDLAKQEASPHSVMPPGLINAMNKDEVLDLLAYMISRGDPEAEAFK
jgi:putative heme-binding domain-containing protein